MRKLREFLGRSCAEPYFSVRGRFGDYQKFEGVGQWHLVEQQLHFEVAFLRVNADLILSKSGLTKCLSHAWSVVPGGTKSAVILLAWCSRSLSMMAVAVVADGTLAQSAPGSTVILMSAQSMGDSGSSLLTEVDAANEFLGLCCTVQGLLSDGRRRRPCIPYLV